MARLILLLALSLTMVSRVEAAAMIDQTYCEGRALMSTATYDAVGRKVPKALWLTDLEAQRNASPKGSLLWTIVPQAKIDAEEIYNHRRGNRNDLYINHFRTCMTFAGMVLR